MARIKILIATLIPIAMAFVLISLSWMKDKTYWYFRGYEYYSEWVYTGLADPDIVMRESGDSSREYIFDHISKINSISLNEFGDRDITCSSPSVIGLGDSQMFGSGLDDEETFPAYVHEIGGPCMYNAGRHSVLDSLRNPNIRTKEVLVTSTERDGFIWYCETSPSEWDLSFEPADNFMLRQQFSLRAAVATAFDRTMNVLRSKIQNLIALRINAPDERLIKYQHSFSEVDLEANLDCLEQMKYRFDKEGIESTYMLFPAAQTMYPKSAPREVDGFTLTFISKLSIEASERGINVVDSRTCLLSNPADTHQLHDTHMSGVGMKALAKCYVETTR